MLALGVSKLAFRPGPAALALAALWWLWGRPAWASIPQQPGADLQRSIPAGPGPRPTSPQGDGAAVGLWWHPSGLGWSGPFPSVELSSAGPCCRLKVFLVAAGAASHPDAASQALGGAGLQAEWRLAEGRMWAGWSRSTRYPPFPGPLRLADGDASSLAPAAAVYHGGWQGGAWQLQALYVPEAPTVWAHNRHIWGVRAGASLQGQATEAGQGLSWGIQWATVHAGPQLLVFRSQPARWFEQHEEAIVSHVQRQRGVRRLTVAVGVYRWWRNDGGRQEQAWDPAGIVRLVHAGTPRWRLALQGSGPHFRSLLADDTPVSRDRLELEAGWSSGMRAPRVQVYGSSGWVWHSGDWVHLDGRLAVEPRWRQGSWARPTLAWEWEKEGSEPVVGRLGLGVRGRRWFVDGAWGPAGPVLRAEWAGAPGARVSLQWRPGQEAGRVEWRWERPVAGLGLWRWHGVYKWRPQQPDRYAYLAATWQLGASVEVDVYLGRWDRGQWDDLFGEPRRFGVLVRYREPADRPGAEGSGLPWPDEADEGM
ncbi:MAG TPA: hypothetical protein VIL11_07215 [Limnochordales bacterium]